MDEATGAIGRVMIATCEPEDSGGPRSPPPPDRRSDVNVDVGPRVMALRAKKRREAACVEPGLRHDRARPNPGCLSES
ncbi:hypothetical protein [Burkholderia sp. MSMB1589WGS]|uniref:hypothetical protein n=1 Tax=Burkholderia sp. MSMB1589WGS TaxID=1636425 RepID=UPI000AD1375A|nr:hypothetical protein [Burkholderia sp. MSMB1589WGS]